MFYSQFILAKKGPLGTIWIAAHLERKLRKNQVADTDIGLSVDSILFPEVPIALRLSSHLLLGVVRIYSKKVNYLFHDCSEALVKIKQAFRSTAVDLPPDESTAPYHSITLPETFDLDNFELPESALLSSNFVDHHVSTKEQITLQDTGNRTSHQTSMFGLDERFGDDDTSHIGLELEQELFMDKQFSPLHASFSVGSKEGVLHSEHSLLTSSLGNGGQLSYNKGNYSETPNVLSELLCNNHDREGVSCLESLRKNEDTSHRHSYSIQTPDLNEVFIPDCQMAPSPYIALTPEEVQTPCLIEPAQGPSTPGLLEEVMPSNFQEIPALSPQERAATPAEPGRPWRSSGHFMEVEYAEAGNETGHTNTSAMDHTLGGTAEGLSSSAVFEQRSGSLAQTYLDENVTTHNSCLPSDTENTIGKSACNEMNDVSVSDQMLDNREVILPSAISDETGFLDLHIKLATLSGAEPISSNFSTDNVNKVDVSGANWDAKTTAHNCTEPSNTSSLGHAEDIGSCLIGNTSGFHLRPCSSNLHLDVTLEGISELSHREQFCSLEIPIREEGPQICESSREVQGEDLHSTNFGNSNQEQKQNPVCMYSCVKSGVIEPHELSTCDLSKVIQLDRFNYSTSSEFREPEKMLAPACIVDFPNDRGQETAEKGVAESDVSVDRISSLYSKKRQLMDSKQTGTAAKLSGVPRSWRKAVPDDDDLLASILVGRKSQLLKVGTLLPPSTASSHKRPRTMSKVGMLKRRKVLVDDTMFLHADIIRQQLTNTEDIRRIRKKAPCTRPDIWRIHIYEAEDDIFKNCVLTGVIPELNSLECQSYNLHENLSAQVKNHNSHAKTSEEADSCRTSQFVNEAGSEALGGSVLTLSSQDHVEDKSPLVINGVDMEHAHEDVKHLVVKEQLEPMLVHSQLEPLKGPISMVTEMEAVVNLDHVGDNDPLVVSGADMEPAHENVKQLVVKDQMEQISIRPQMEPLIDGPISFMSEKGTFAMRDSQLTMTETYITENVETCAPPEKHDNDHETINNSMMSEMEADPHGGFHLMMTETYIAENAEACLPFEKPDDGSTIVMEQPLPPEGQDRQNTLLDGLEHVTKETTDNSAVVFMDSECLIHAEDSNAVGTSSKDKEKHANEVECVASLSAPTEQISSTVEENSVVQEYNLDDGLHMYANPIDVAAARDSSDFYGAMDDNCAELLNVDDEADLDVAENDAPDPESAKLLENSGWSVRTRGVAKYLKNLFYEESMHGRRTVAVDRLLSGKTRKEASRMFFETLVLKSMDYIQVQQETPFSYVHIKPTIKLQESEF